MLRERPTSHHWEQLFDVRPRLGRGFNVIVSCCFDTVSQTLRTFPRLENYNSSSTSKTHSPTRSLLFPTMIVEVNELLLLSIIPFHLTKCSTALSSESGSWSDSSFNTPPERSTTRSATLAPLMYAGDSWRKRSWPAVSHNCKRIDWISN